MDTPRTARTTTGSRTPRTTARSAATPRTPARALTTARPSAVSARETTARFNQSREGSSVFDRLTTAIPSSTANRYVTLPKPKRKVSWTQASPAPAAQSRRATTANVTDPLPPSDVALPASTTAMAHLTGPLIANHEKTHQTLPCATATGTQRPHLLPAQPSAPTKLPPSHHTQQVPTRLEDAHAVSRPIVVLPAAPTQRQSSPDPVPPIQTSGDTAAKDPLTPHGAPLSQTAPTVKTPAVSTGVHAVPRAQGLGMDTASPVTVPTSGTASASPHRETKTVRKQPPVAPQTGETHLPRDLVEEPTHSLKSTDARVPGLTLPASLDTTMPPVEMIDETISLTSEASDASVTRRGTSSPQARRTLFASPRRRASVSSSPLAQQYHRLLDSDGDGVVSADDLFCFILLHADAVLSVSLRQLETLLSCSLVPPAAAEDACIRRWRLDPTAASAEAAVSTLLLLAAHTDHGAVIRRDWIEAALEAVLAAAVSTADVTELGDRGRMRKAEAVATSCPASHSPHQDTYLGSRLAPTRVSSRGLSPFTHVAATEHIAEYEVDVRCSQTSSHGLGQEESAESVMTLSVGSWSAASTRALLRSIQFREITHTPAFLTATAVEALVQTDFAFANPTSAAYAHRKRLADDVAARLVCAGTDAADLLTQLATQLSGPLLLHAFVQQLHYLDTAQLAMRGSRRPLASPLRASLWRLSVPIFMVGQRAPPRLHVCVVWVMLSVLDVLVEGMVWLARRSLVTPPEGPLLPSQMVRFDSALGRRQHVTGITQEAVDRAVREMCVCQGCSRTGEPGPHSASLSTLTARLSPAVVAAVSQCVPYLPFFRSARDEDALCAALQFSSRCDTQRGPHEGAHDSSTGPERRNSSVPLRLLLTLAGVVLATNPRLCLRVMTCCRALWVAVGFTCAVTGCLWYGRAAWRALLKCVWQMPSCHDKAPRANASLLSALRHRPPETQSQCRAHTRAVVLYALWARRGAAFCPLQASPHMRWLLCQQAEWWALDFVPFFCAPANARETRLGELLTTAAEAPALYHIPLPVYVTLAVLYNMARATADMARSDDCISLRDTAPAQWLWHTLNSLALLPTLRVAPSSDPTDAHAEAEAPLLSAPAMEDVDVLTHPFCEQAVRSGVDLVQRLADDALALTPDTPPPPHLLDALCHVIHTASADSLTNEADVAERTTILSCGVDSRVFPFAVTGPADKASWEILPFTYRCLWRRDQRECASVFASALFLFCPMSEHGSISGLKRQRLLLLIAAVMLSQVGRASSGAVGTAVCDWGGVCAIMSALEALRGSMLTCLRQGDVSGARALVSPHSILSYCMPPTEARHAHDW